MLKRVLVLAIVAGALTFVGCGEGGGSSSGRVAVVDLTKIAEDIGQKSKIEEAREVRERNLQISVRVLQNNVQAQLVDMAQKIGKKPEAKVPETPTEEEKKAIEEWVGKMRNLEQGRLNAVNQIRQAYAKQRQANQAAMVAEITKIRDRIKPLAEAVAKSKGLDIVITTSSVLVHDNAVDITSDVFEKVNALLSNGEFPTVKIPDPIKVTRATTQPAGGGTTPAPKTPAPKTP